MEVTCVVDAKNLGGECPVWCPREKALYWVDIIGCLIQRYIPSTGAVSAWKMPERVTSFALREQGGLVASLSSGFAFIDLPDGKITPLQQPEAGNVENNFNDGKCDRRGRFWAGSRNVKWENHSGALYRLSPDQSCRLMQPGVGCANGLAWSPDNKIFYFGDSKDQTIYAYDFDLDSGDIVNRRPFVISNHEPLGMPDGMTVDEQGFLWSVECYRGRVVRYDPKGRVDRVIEMPVQLASSCMFGGESLSTLYVTSIAATLSAAELARQPLAGGLFAIEVGVKGLPEPRFAVES